MDKFQKNKYRFSSNTPLVLISDEIIDYIIELSNKYIKNRFPNLFFLF